MRQYVNSPFRNSKKPSLRQTKEGRLQLLMRTLAETREAREKERKEESGEPTPQAASRAEKGK